MADFPGGALCADVSVRDMSYGDILARTGRCQFGDANGGAVFNAQKPVFPQNSGFIHSVRLLPGTAQRNPNRNIVAVTGMQSVLGIDGAAVTSARKLMGLAMDSMNHRVPCAVQRRPALWCRSPSR